LEKNTPTDHKQANFSVSFLGRRGPLVVMKLCLASFLALLALFSSGCESTKANSQKTLAGIQYAADAAMKVWGSYVAKEQKRADALPDGERQAAHARLLERRLQVDEARRKFSAAWKLAFIAADYDNSKASPIETIAALAELKTLTAH
jgi:hypothetical protein